MYKELPPNVSINPDKRIVDMLVKKMSENGGYCPCRIQHLEEYLCPCTEFRDQVADPEFSGFCHCHLYLKEKK